MDKFEKHSNYNEQTSFTQINFGHDTGLLETELNELQQIQESTRLSNIRKMIYSGFTELVQKDFTGDPIIYNPTDNGLTLTNKIAIAPFKCFVNGYEINAQGNFTYNKLSNYILVDLGKTGEESTKDSLVYLEVWFEIAKGDDQIKKFGYNSGDTVGTPALDTRVGEETSRRIILCWDIRVKNECDFNNYPEGLGYTDILHYSSVCAKANGQFGNVANVNLVYAPAGNDLFIDEQFHEDKNLYVAGRKDYELSSSTLYGKYAFALPMFRIRRRNSSTYTLTNFNGAPSYNKMMVVNDSSKTGDLLNNMRPDHLAYDVINKNDIIDLRKTINFSSYNYNVMCNSSARKLFNNQLTTKQTEKIRRVQFGNSHMNHNDIPNATLIVPFEKTTLPEKPAYDINNPITYETSVKYEDSVCSTGAKIENQTVLTYIIKNTVQTLMNSNHGTVDFYMKPFWDGCDKDDNQIIFMLGNESNSPIIKLEKSGTNLILSQYNYEEQNDNFIKSEAIVDLTQTIIKSNQYYHIRASWTEDPMPTNGQIYLYINGSLCAQSDYNPCSLVAYKFSIGNNANINTKGFLIEELICYSTNFEILSMNGSNFGYAKNKFWPMLPNDFMNSNTLLMPSFNSITNNFSDNAHVQKDTIIHRTYDKTQSLKTFTILLNSDKIIRSVEYIYDLSGNIVTGVLSGLGTNSITFKPYDQTIEQILFQCTLELSSGCGGQDMPTKILSAAIVKYDEEATNYDYNLNLNQEVSFNDINALYPRVVSLLKPRKVAGNEDSAYDFSNSTRTKKQCYARLIYYNVSGNGTNQYNIPMNLYGYKVIGVIGSKTQKIVKVTKIPSSVVGEDDLYYTVYLKNTLLIGDTITFELATEGYSFDYDLNSKTLISDVCKCKLLQFVADGTHSTYTLPCCSVSEEGIIHGGVLKSVFTFTDNELDDNGDITSTHNEYIQCYHDGEIFYDEHGKPTDERLYNTMNVKITDSSFGTPFITIIFDEDSKPRKGVVIQIPIMITYQFTSDTLLSLWYNYIPYQGTMDSGVHEITRITDWTYFITTLSTGKDSNEVIKQNIVNNLPGGSSYGWSIDNKDIVLTNVFEHMTNTIQNNDLNKKLIFMNDFMLKNNEDICNLETSYKVTKVCSEFQDSLISISNINFDLFFNDCKNAINKYIGAFCGVRTETGEIMLFVIGSLNYTSTLMNHLYPQYGDLYRIEKRPTEIID